MPDLWHNRRDTAANWTANDPVLEDGQIGVETDDTSRIKVGDGVTAWSALDYVGTGLGGGGGGGGVNDLQYVCPATQTSIDEFSDDSLDAAWVRVDKSGGAGRADWIEAGDVLSVYNSGGDSSQEMHALVQPLASPMAVGDAIVTRSTQLNLNAGASYLMAGIVLADGTASGAGVQVAGFNYGAPGGYTVAAPFTNYQAWGSFSQDNSLTVPVTTWLRLVKLASNVWRTDFSPDGIHWLHGPTCTVSTTPTHVGVFSSSWGTSTKHVVTFNLIRRDSGVS